MDELLKKAFLDLDMSKAEDSKLMDQMAQQVMHTDLFVNSNSTNKQIKKTIKVKPWLWYLSASTIALGIIVTAFIVFDKSTDKLPISEEAKNKNIEPRE